MQVLKTTFLELPSFFVFLHLFVFSRMAPNMFYGDYQHNKNPLDFLTSLEESLAMLPNLSEPKKCKYLYLHCPSGSMAEDWYENLVPSVTALWSTLVLHFHVKWL